MYRCNRVYNKGDTRGKGVRFITFGGVYRGLLVFRVTYISIEFTEEREYKYIIFIKVREIYK